VCHVVIDIQVGDVVIDVQVCHAVIDIQVGDVAIDVQVCVTW